MKIQKAVRMQNFQQNIFSEMADYKNKKISEGMDIIDLSVGSPDLPPPQFIIDALSKSVTNPNMYGYALKGIKEFHEGVQEYYQKNHSVHLDRDKEILSLMGSQDGLVHLPMVICDPGDVILVPDPGYTAYAAGAALAGAEMYSMPLKKENQYLPVFNEIPENICEKAKLMILNFPGNPIPGMATKGFFEEAITFAKKHNIVILHDFAYCELYYEEKPLSFLSVEGAKEVGIEMNSLSKSFNMAGCRVAYAAGNEEIIALLGNLKSNLDYGVFLPIQLAAVHALRDQSDFLEKSRSIYRKRRDTLVDGFNNIGWQVDSPKASMFMWAEVPSHYTSKQFALELLDTAGVVVTPGNAFGKWGEGFVRVALVQPEETLLIALEKLRESKIFL
ncbi:LL-diaminopimelate aminotransferase [Bacillus dakarensis]|uniref:LL-diaminopimelate aminotransferase n=1 Tax=Robertmurraya dakarensis TaxID=1926278 RepID=UPI0009816548|nr:LL-diaminopimelate aminotransferase [Bacillus dakarensis]